MLRMLYCFTRAMDVEPSDEFYELTPEDIAVAMRDGNARKKASAGDLKLR